MCRCKEPSRGPPSRRCRFYLSMSYWLGVWGKRIAGYPTSADWRNDRMAARTSDQRWRSLILFVFVVGNPHEPAALRGFTGLCWIASVGDGSTAIGLFPATPSSAVGAGRVWPSSLLVYWRHRAASSAEGSTPVGWCIPGASDTYTKHRSISPICNTTVTSHQSKGYRTYIKNR